MEPLSEHQHLELEYAQINDNIRFLADVRFKLLALIPALGGTGIFVLTRAGLDLGSARAMDSTGLFLILLVSLLGFLATLGITLYDQRNSELYNALIHRAKYLEREFFCIPGAPGSLKPVIWGGQYNERPGKARRLIFQAGHDLALALIYGPLLGAWFFPILYPLLMILNDGEQPVQQAAAGAWAAVIAVVIFTTRLITLDKREHQHYVDAAQEDGLSENVLDKSSLQAKEA